MSHQIIKQPNGKYCIFSSIVDNIIIYNATPDEIKKYYIEEEVKEINKKVDQAINSPQEYYYGWPFNNFDDMCKEILGLHEGQDKIIKEFKKYKKEMEKGGNEKYYGKSKICD